jgi:pimeloyl-ACP methyl ester carboxylesterase
MRLHACLMTSAIRRRIPAILPVMALIATSLAPASAASASVVPAANQQCENVQIPVSLSQGAPQDQTIVGQICYPDGQNAIPGAIQVLVSGATYGSWYWDPSYQPSRYSYVDAANNAGFATFNFDRIGIGQSSHPLSTSVTLQSNAYVIHQLIQDLRAGTIDGNQYDQVVIVGHSLGSLIAWTEAGTYHDVNGVIVSGILHAFYLPGMVNFISTLYPAALDPKFLGKIIDPGYLTMRPGTRESVFYYPPDTDPQMVQQDERNKQTATIMEAAGAYLDELPGELRPVTGILCTIIPGICDGPTSWAAYGITDQINVPVLDVVGQYDSLFCGGPNVANQCQNVSQLQAQESAYYTDISPSCFTLKQLPMAGHDLDLELNAQDWFSMANSWATNLLQTGVC